MNRRVAKNAEKVASLRERQQVIVTRLAESGVSDEELKLATNEATVRAARDPGLGSSVIQFPPSSGQPTNL